MRNVLLAITLLIAGATLAHAQPGVLTTAQLPVARPQIEEILKQR